METNGNDMYMIIVTVHDLKIMRALGNTVDLEPRNCCISFRCKTITQGLSIKRRFVLIVGRKSSEGNIIRNNGLPHRETARKDRSISLKNFVRSQTSDVELASTTVFH